MPRDEKDDLARVDEYEESFGQATAPDADESDRGTGDEMWGEPDTSTSPIELQAPRAGKGPFAVEAIDPLIYRHSEDSPELRMAAQNVPRSPKLEIREAPPVRRSRRFVSAWVPGAAEDSEPPEQQGNPSSTRSNAARLVLVAVLTAIPLIIIFGLVYAGMALYSPGS